MESNWVDFKAIKQSVTLAQMLDRYGVKLKRSGKELRGKCPIHRGEGTDTFHAHLEKNAVHCFSCQAKGNVLDFVAAMERCSIRDAALRIQSWLAIPSDAPGAARQSQPETTSQLATKEVGERDE